MISGWEAKDVAEKLNALKEEVETLGRKLQNLGDQSEERNRLGFEKREELEERIQALETRLDGSGGAPKT